MIQRWFNGDLTNDKLGFNGKNGQFKQQKCIVGFDHGKYRKW